MGQIGILTRLYTRRSLRSDILRLGKVSKVRPLEDQTELPSSSWASSFSSFSSHRLLVKPTMRGEMAYVGTKVLTRSGSYTRIFFLLVLIFFLRKHFLVLKLFGFCFRRHSCGDCHKA